MRVFTALMAVSAMIGSAPAAQAKGKPDDNALGLVALRNFALCSVERSSDGAANLLSMEVGSAQYNKALRRFAKGHDYCAARSRLSFGGLLFAGDLAEALLLTRYRGAAAFSSLASQPNRAPRSLLEEVGACVARQRPEAIRALVAADPASEAERAALKATGDVLAACVPTGQTLKLNKPAIRAMYALGAYRLLTATPSKEG